MNQTQSGDEARNTTQDQPLNRAIQADHFQPGPENFVEMEMPYPFIVLHFVTLGPVVINVEKIAWYTRSKVEKKGIPTTEIFFNAENRRLFVAEHPDIISAKIADSYDETYGRRWRGHA